MASQEQSQNSNPDLWLQTSSSVHYSENPLSGSRASISTAMAKSLGQVEVGYSVEGLCVVEEG
jgi:hypothetical protein